MDTNANTRELTVAELDRIAGGESSLTNYTNTMTMISTVLRMMSDIQKNTISNLR